MIVQYLIDWDSFLCQSSSSIDDRTCESLIRLTKVIRRNGCLVVSTYSKRMIALHINSTGKALPNSVLCEFESIGKDFGLMVDEGTRPAENLQSTIEAWKQYAFDAGARFKKADPRYVLVTKNASGRKGSFYCELCPDAVLASNLALEWSRLQHFNKDNGSGFRDYLESFVATADEYIRVYDPYLSTIFDSVVESGNVKAWRNSFAFLLSVFLRNNHVKCFDFVTRMTKQQRDLMNCRGEHILLFSEVVELLKRYVEKRSERTELSFHFVDGDRSFHDRFFSNGRFCFAIGHGCDVCEIDNGFIDLVRRKREGEYIHSTQWRSMPRQGEEKFTDFNVFYGCSKKNAPKGHSVFKERKPHCSGEAEIYPAHCRARKFEEILHWFDFSRTADMKNPIRITPNVFVSINPLTCDRDF